MCKNGNNLTHSANFKAWNLWLFNLDNFSESTSFEPIIIEMFVRRIKRMQWMGACSWMLMICIILVFGIARAQAHKQVEFIEINLNKLSRLANLPQNSNKEQPYRSLNRIFLTTIQLFSIDFVSFHFISSDFFFSFIHVHSGINICKIKLNVFPFNIFRDCLIKLKKKNEEHWMNRGKKICIMFTHFDDCFPTFQFHLIQCHSLGAPIKMR